MGAAGAGEQAHLYALVAQLSLGPDLSAGGPEPGTAREPRWRTSCNTFNRSRSRWLKVIRSVSMGPSAIHESGHFYFAQTGHSHFAATATSRGLARPIPVEVR